MLSPYGRAIVPNTATSKVDLSPTLGFFNNAIRNTRIGCVPQILSPMGGMCIHLYMAVLVLMTNLMRNAGSG